jgi:hypothetical protein
MEYFEQIKYGLVLILLKLYSVTRGGYYSAEEYLQMVQMRLFSVKVSKESILTLEL